MTERKTGRRIERRIERRAESLEGAGGEWVSLSLSLIDLPRLSFKTALASLH